MKNKIAFSNLRVEMARNQINITELARMIGINRSTLSNQLDNKCRSFPYVYAVKISAIFGKSPEYLFAELLENEVTPY